MNEWTFLILKGVFDDKATYRLTHEVLQAFSNGSNLSGMFCDLVTAFGCANHNTLVTKLSCGINSYFMSYK